MAEELIQASAPDVQPRERRNIKTAGKAAPLPPPQPAGGLARPDARLSRSSGKTFSIVLGLFYTVTMTAIRNKE